jgi:hypothetical protein
LLLEQCQGLDVFTVAVAQEAHALARAAAILEQHIVRLAEGVGICLGERDAQAEVGGQDFDVVLLDHITDRDGQVVVVEAEGTGGTLGLDVKRPGKGN